MKDIAVALYLLGVILAVVSVAYNHKKRLQGRWLTHVIADVLENPFPALLGYTLKFACSWVTVVDELFIKDLETEPDGTVKKNK